MLLALGLLASLTPGQGHRKKFFAAVALAKRIRAGLGRPNYFKRIR
jgi:hypothetical protein